MAAWLRPVGCVLVLAAPCFPARADVFSYEIVNVAGPNNVVDSNSSSCDSVEGCYTRTGTRCSASPNQLCDLQIVPGGRCSYGDLSAGLASCVWPHRAGRCVGNPKVGCLTEAECAGLAPSTCDMTIDKYGWPTSPADAIACGCTNATATAVCGGSLSVCSDGDPMRDRGGLGTTFGMEVKLGGVGSQTYANMGPAYTGASQPTSTPPFELENPPATFHPQRDAGTTFRTLQGTGPIHPARTTQARDVSAYSHPTIPDPSAGLSPITSKVRKVETFGDSYWEDWVTSTLFMSTATFNSNRVVMSCDPPLGWTVGTPVSGGLHCHEAARNGLAFLWSDDLTSAQKTSYSSGGTPVCPPHCSKDFNLSTLEVQAFSDAALLDPNAGIQLAIQSGEVAASRVAGAGDAIGVDLVTELTWLNESDLRCRLGGWGNPAGFVGRCSDGPSACDPDAVNCGMGGGCCLGQGSSCRACNGPFDAVTNPLGLPIGYNTHGRPELDLVTYQRIGGLAGANADLRLPLLIVHTTGNAAADFRDEANEGAPDVDLADLGPVNPASSFASGVGTGGTFVNGTMLDIGEPCCGTGAGTDVVWGPEAGGVVATGFEDGFAYRYGLLRGDEFFSDWALVYDKGPGPDGIPGCIGDNALGPNNGSASCDQRLGFGSAGAKTNGFYATGRDDRAILRPVGATAMPAVGARFGWGYASAAVHGYFGTVQNPPTINTAAAFTLRDVSHFAARSADILIKANTTACPLIPLGPQCSTLCIGLGGDTDVDGVCNTIDNCPTVANPGQENGGGGLETPIDSRGDACDNCPTVSNASQADLGEIQASNPADGVGDACDNCRSKHNPRVPGWTPAEGGASYLASNPWATLTGGQRDDDHDGYGNRCDAKFVGLPSAAVGGLDLAQFRASNAEDRRLDTCGTSNTSPCAIFDLDQGPVANTIGGFDLGVFRELNAAPPGPRCALCTGTGSAPLPCVAGTAGTC